MSVVGVDGCKRGWIAVEVDPERPPRAHFLPTIGHLTTVAPTATVVAIDIPIGLPTSGPRAADREARRLVGPKRGSSVFPTPPRAMLVADDYEAANGLAASLGVTRISKQSWGLRHRIFEVEEWIDQHDNDCCRVVEVHPEVSFAVMKGSPLTASKKTWAGMVERVRALERAGISLADVMGQATAEAATDDMLDAGVAAWTAARVHLGTAISFPSPPEEFGDGATAAIWA